MDTVADYDVFDAHFHVIDPRFPLAPNNGYLPDPFTVDDYLHRVDGLHVNGDAVVSGSFQAFDQSHLKDALVQLGPLLSASRRFPRTPPITRS